MGNVEKSINGITISIDYKVELIGLLITLSDEFEKFAPLFCFDESNDQYINELKVKFYYLKNHKTFLKFMEIKEKYYLHYDKPIEMMLSLNEDFEFKKESNFKFKDTEEIKKFCRELKLLSEEINFEDFYHEHRKLYTSWINSISKTYENHNVKDSIVSYCGEQYKAYKFYTNLIPFETSGGYGILLDGEAHNCLRARKITHDNLLFFVENDLFYLPTSIHEYLHSIINPLTAKYGYFTNDTKYLFNEENTISGYNSDIAMANETIIRAMTVRIYYLITGIFDEERLVRDEEKGFKRIRTVYNKLMEYENNRETYQDIDSFYLNMAKAISGNLE